MKESTRLIATLIIWIALASVIGSSITSPTGAIGRADDATLFGIVAILTIAAMISTVAIWIGGWRAAVAQAKAQREARYDDSYDGHLARGKQKRLSREPLGHDRLARLIEQLDDEDIYDLETLLLARDGDGEIPHKQQQS